jgi:D-glycero-beta-D-manno-heptose 1-phosphate adenylyltransferase
MIDSISNKIFTTENIKLQVENWKAQGYEIVFTNGCFDIIHYGHLSYLADASKLGHKLIVAINSAASVKRLKGEHRPIQDEMTRQYQLAALSYVDAVIIFDEDTPANIINQLIPDILVKGGDWNIDAIIGAETVLEYGGRVLNIPFIEGYSTTNIEQKILNQKR